MTAFLNRFLPYRRHADWLDEATLNALPAYAAGNQAPFKPSKIRRRDGMGAVNPERRFSLRLADLGLFRPLLRDRALGALAETCAALGTPPFDPRQVKVELVAHGDGQAPRPSPCGAGPQPVGSLRAENPLGSTK